MPFTPYHLGPGLAFGLLFRKKINSLSFIIASLLPDLEPLTIIILKLNYPLHGFFHTFIFSSILTSVFGYLFFLFIRTNLPKYLEGDAKKYISSSILGGILHIILDSPLYHEMMPFYPYTINPFFSPNSENLIYSFCIWTGLLSIIIILIKLVKNIDKINSHLL